MRHHVLLLSLLAPLSLVACGGADSEPVSQANAEAQCRALCTYDAECRGTSVDSCVTECAASVVGVLRTDSLGDFVECVTGNECFTSDEACLDQCEPLAAHDAYEAACRDTFGSCFEPDQVDRMCEVNPAIRDDEGFLCMIAPTIVDEFTRCFDGGASCDSASDCLAALAQHYGIDI